MSSSASLDNFARSSYPTTTPTAPFSPVAEYADPFTSSTPEPSSAPEPSSSAPAPSSLPKPNTTAIAALLQNGDRTFGRLSKILSTPSGTDRLLATTCYTLTLLSSLITTRLTTNIEKIASQFAEKASLALEPGESVMATFPIPPLTKHLASLANSSQKLASLISDYRIFTRLWGLLGLYAWGKSVYLNPPSDSFLKVVAYTQVGVNVCFQTLENMAYLASKGIITRDSATQTRDWKWSSRFWMSHVVLDFLRLYRTRSLRHARVDKLGEEDKEAKALRKDEEATWWREFVVNACYFPMTIHWSTDGILSPTQVGALGSVAGGTSLRYLWKNAA
ncbi:peroxin 11c [Venturia nashicola]|uniref:Peroxin 11c n=1 Tax=Venturia nashicola TaxID=86259 RepID=A0A4Z1NYL4_9PEZI|nr:peroxin 11c [Venturia nashicola]TLD29416.1 peroxin 11c [Venturia nashicola]